MIRPILLLSFFIAFTANNIAQEQQYRIWFNDKPKSVHSVDEPRNSYRNRLSPIGKNRIFP